MLARRIATAAFWLPVHLAVLIWGRPYHWLIYLEVILFICLLEMFDLLAATGRRPHRLAVLAAALACLIGFAYKPAVSFWSALALAGACLAIPVFRRRPEGALADGGVSLLAFGYLAGFLGCLMLIRLMADGMRLLLVLFITIWIIDIAAYTFGRWLGRHKLAPALSPGKTIEGGVAGIIAGIAAAPLLAVFAFPTTGLGWLGGLAVGVAVAAGDLVGDLAESAMKRDAGVKDSGGFLRGHGGVLDRFDAVLFCAPIFYAVVLLVRR